MLNASSETTTAPRIEARQPQGRDLRPPQTGFASLVDDNVAAKADPSPRRPTGESDAASRSVAPDKTRDNQAADDRSTQETDRKRPSSDESSSASPAADAKTDPSGEKPKTTDKAAKPPPADGAAQPATAIAGADLALTLPDPAASTPLASPVNPVAVAVPLPAAPTVTSAQPPLAIAAAGIATAKSAGKIGDKTAGGSTPNVLSADGDPSGPATTQTSDAIDGSSPAAMTVAGRGAKLAAGGKETVSSDIDTGFAKAGDAKAADAKALNGAAAAVNAPSAVKGNVKPEAPDAEAKPQVTPTNADTTPSPAASAQPHEHRTAATSVAATIDTSPGVTPTIAPQNPAQAAPAASPTAQLTASVATAAPVPLDGLAVELASRAQSGASRFDIRLDPAELGRIDVRIDIDRNGAVTSHLTVEKPETLAMLRQDSPQLQRALNDAGLKTPDGSLQFSLGDQSQQRQNFSGGAQQTQRFIIRDNETVAPTAPVLGYGRTLASRSGVDISV